MVIDLELPISESSIHFENAGLKRYASIFKGGMVGEHDKFLGFVLPGEWLARAGIPIVPIFRPGNGNERTHFAHRICVLDGEGVSHPYRVYDGDNVGLPAPGGEDGRKRTP